MLLTQSTTPIIGWIATLLGYVMEFSFLLFEFHWHSEHWIMYYHIYHYCSIINAAVNN